jgi:predicted GNAT superfamily acetyltransferase
MSESSPPTIRVAMCETVAELHACEDLQVAVWGGGEREITPYDIMRAILHAGGTVLGAWDGDQLVGMALSIVAWSGAGAYHHSHLLGVLPEYRRYNVGMRLKLAQRDFVLAQGLNLIMWTFDPLESANAHLNFAKLGVVSDTYLPDFYGAMPEALNAGLPSDRLLVEWRLDAPHVLGRLATGAAATPLGALVTPEVYDAPFLLRMADDGSPIAAAPDRGVTRVRIEVPASIQDVKVRDPRQALAWRLATRAAFVGAFSAGYLATDYRAPRFHRPACGCYVLALSPEPPSA